MSVFKWDATITLTCEVEVDYLLEDRGVVYIENVTHDGVTVELSREQWDDLYAALEEVVQDLDGAQP
mgnify:CR=1 FL=1|jgi:hypothetical protein|tara:strand:- start:1118 stop:1318 length:201 start_codon:yes stop_codon:yes gene_type:complete